MKEIFARAAALPVADRAAWLDVACAGQPELRAEVEELLHAHEASGFMAGVPRNPQIESELARLKPEEARDRVGTAAAPSAAYKFRKFVWRNKTALRVATTVVLFLLGVIAFVMWATTQSFRQTAERVSKSNEILQLGNELVRSVAEMESICLGFLITGEESSLNGHNLAKDEANDALERLKILTADLPEQRQRVDRLRLDVSRIKEIETKEIAARSTGGFSEGAEEFAESRVRDVIQDLRTVTFDLQHTERLQLIDRSEQANLAGRAVIVFTLGATGIAFIVLVGAEVLIRGDVSRRQRK